MTTAPPVRPPATIKGSHVVKGLGWNFIAVIGEQLSSLVAFVLIARILGPSDFGVVILAVALVDVMITFVRSGISEALIRAPELSPELLGTGFWLNMIMSCLIAGGLFFFAPAFARLVNVQQTAQLLQTMTIAFPIAAAGAIAEAMLSRRMAFAAIARRQILGGLAGAGVAVFLAFSGFGVWAMIFQRIVVYFVGAGLAIWAAKLVPPRKFSLKAAREILHFAGGITSINVLYRLQPRAAELAIGFLANPASVALYRAAYRVVDLVNQLPVQPVMRVIFPTLSRLADDPDRFREVLRKFMEGLQTVLLPAYVVIGYFATDLFHLLFGSKWDGAVSAFVLLLAAAGLRITFALMGPATSSRGAVRTTATFTLIDVGLSIGLMIPAATLGIDAIAGSRILGALILWPLAYFMLMRPAGVTFVYVMQTLKRPVIISLLLLAAMVVTDHLLAALGFHPNLFIKAPFCGLLYIALVLFVSRDSVAELLSVLNLQNSRLSSFGRKFGLIS